MKFMKHRVQTYDKKRGKYVKYNTRNGEEMQAKQDGKPFARVPVMPIVLTRKEVRL